MHVVILKDKLSRYSRIERALHENGINMSQYEIQEDSEIWQRLIIKNMNSTMQSCDFLH